MKRIMMLAFAATLLWGGNEKALAEEASKEVYSPFKFAYVCNSLDLVKSWLHLMNSVGSDAEDPEGCQLIQSPNPRVHIIAFRRDLGRYAVGRKQYILYEVKVPLDESVYLRFYGYMHINDEQTI